MKIDSIMEEDINPESSPRIDITDDPVEFTQKLLTSDIFEEEYNAFKDSKPISEEILQELPDQNQETVENYQKFRFLNQTGEDLVHTFRSFGSTHLKYNYEKIPVGIRDAVKDYVGQIKDINRAANDDSVNEEETAIYSHLRSKYHNEAGDKVAAYLTKRGALPKYPFEDEESQLRGFGRGIVTLLVRDRYPELDSDSLRYS